MHTDILPEKKKGILYVVATPIGNLGDITLRALEILKTVDFIAAEDTRQTGKLLAHFQIQKPLLSYFEHNKAKRGPQIIAKLLAGESAAIVSDAGTPGISDPGVDIVKSAVAADIPVTMAPGPVAGIMALVLSGLSTDRFIFEGFLPEERKKRGKILTDLKTEQRTVILYESPHRLLQTLREMYEVFGPARRVALCRELTKIYEEIVLDTLEAHLSTFETKSPRGEYVLILEGMDETLLVQQKAEQWADISIVEHVESLKAKGLDRKAAIRRAADERGLSRNEVYEQYERQKKEKNERTV